MSSSVSVIVPVHGRVALTRRCLDAVLAEPHAGREVIVVDDASPDDTPATLAAYGDAIRVVTLRQNRGYAAACNAGAEAAGGELLLFLNNDTEPLAGWFEALVAHAEAAPAAAAVGAKLLYPTGAIQHAGVVFGQDGYPHNLYAGLPGNHPAANRSRRLQAVTGACMLVRRGAFEEAGGFDPGFANSLEDVDLCLRIAEAGGEVHYCHRAVVTHLESASRGRQDRFEQSVALYRERWRERVRRDDLNVYVEDGLLSVEYPDAYPLRLEVAPEFAVLAGDRDAEVERLLEGYAHQVSDLLAEVVRLSAIAGEPARASAVRAAADSPRLGESFDHRAYRAHADRLEEEVRDLQLWLERAAFDSARGDAGFRATRSLGYRQLVQRVRAAVAETVPAGASILVISRGDRELLRLDDRDVGHFPQAEDGRYLGHHPRDSEDAVGMLEALRQAGAEYLVIPATASWWLDHYRGFATHLRERYAETELEACAIFQLAGDRARQATGGAVR
jgi:GT2 family glycosyltransferase